MVGSTAEVEQYVMAHEKASNSVQIDDDTPWSTMVKKGRKKKTAAVGQVPKQPACNPNDRPTTKPKGKTVSLIGKAMSTDAIKTVNTRYASIFASRFATDVEPEVLQAHLEHILKLEVTCESLPTRRDTYSSFHVKCNCPDPSVFMNPEVWPEGAYVRWFHEKPRTPRHTTHPLWISQRRTTLNPEPSRLELAKDINEKQRSDR